MKSFWDQASTWTGTWPTDTAKRALAIQDVKMVSRHSSPSLLTHFLILLTLASSYPVEAWEVLSASSPHDPT